LVQNLGDDHFQVNVSGALNGKGSRCNIASSIDDGRGMVFLVYENGSLDKVQISHPSVARLLGREDNLLTTEKVGVDQIIPYEGIKVARDFIFGSPFIDIYADALNKYELVQGFLMDRFALSALVDLQNVQSLSTAVACKKMADSGQVEDLALSVAFGKATLNG
jgi:hypothetical protein